MYPELQRFRVRLKLKYEIERFISLKNNNYIFSLKEMHFSILFVIQLSINVYIIYKKQYIYRQTNYFLLLKNGPTF